MKSFFRYFLFIVFFIGCLHSNIIGQVSSNTANWKIVTAYSLSDTIFVFHQYPIAKNGSLTVLNPFDSTASFTWNKYDTLSNTFGPDLKVDNNVLNSSLNNLAEGGYKISITGTTRDTSFMAWVYFDNYSLAVEKDNAGNVMFGKYTCDYVELSSKVTPIPSFVYKDPNTQKRQLLQNTFIFDWTADPAPELSLITGKASIRIEPPPYKDTHYHLKVTDKFGLVKNDQVFYKSINPKADFELKYEIAYDTTFKVDDAKKSAPLRVTPINKSSENAETYMWYFVGKDTVDKSKTPGFRIYTEPDSFKIKLVVKSLEGCIDSSHIVFAVSPPEIENGDSLANYFWRGNHFKIYNISIKQFKFTVFSRWGVKVYEHNGPDMLEWEGWDGKIGNNEASSGIYFYVLEVFTWDKNHISKLIRQNGKYAGFFYLLEHK